MDEIENIFEKQTISDKKSVEQANQTGQVLQKITLAVNTIKQIHLQISNESEASQESESLNQLASHPQQLMQQFKV